MASKVVSGVDQRRSAPEVVGEVSGSGPPIGAVVTDRRREEVSDGRRFGGAYQGAFEAVFAIVIGAGLGFAADRRFETDPWGILIGIGLGFSAFVLRLLRLGRSVQEAERERRDDSDGPGGSGE
jgi:F0F1-type ATP synthase assembly protein I